METWRQRIKQLKQEMYALYLAYQDPRVPWSARVWLALVVGYAFSPIDLIPDVIPILGYLDDLILIPAGIWLALKLVPPAVLAECRVLAKEKMGQDRPISKLGIVIVVIIWIVSAMLLLSIFSRIF